MVEWNSSYGVPQVSINREFFFCRTYIKVGFSERERCHEFKTGVVVNFDAFKASHMYMKG
jgi:hypothetical protein